MAEEATQLSFPETDSSLPEEHFTTTKEPEIGRLVNVKEGTKFYTGPRNGDYSTFFNKYKAPAGATAVVEKVENVDGNVSHKLRFETPNSLKGKAHWVYYVNGDLDSDATF